MALHPMLGQLAIFTLTPLPVLSLSVAARRWMIAGSLQVGCQQPHGSSQGLHARFGDQTVGNILKRHGLPLAPERKTTTTWKEFIRTHLDVLVAADFFTAEVWTLGGLVTYYVLFSGPSRAATRQGQSVSPAAPPRAPCRSRRLVHVLPLEGDFCVMGCLLHMCEQLRGFHTSYAFNRTSS